MNVPQRPDPIQSAAPSARDTPLRRLGRRAIEEGKRILGIFVYLWVVFGVLVLHEFIVLSRYGIGYRFYGIAFINAWILAKVMLLAESLDTRPHFQGRPLAYPILARACAFAALLMGAYTAEETAVGLWRGHTLAGSVPAIGGGGVRGYLAMAVFIAVALVPYVAFRELGRVLGKDHLHDLLFKGGHPAASFEDR